MHSRAHTREIAPARARARMHSTGRQHSNKGGGGAHLALDRDTVAAHDRRQHVVLQRHSAVVVQELAAVRVNHGCHVWAGLGAGCARGRHRRARHVLQGRGGRASGVVACAQCACSTWAALQAALARVPWRERVCGDCIWRRKHCTLAALHH